MSLFCDSIFHFFLYTVFSHVYLSAHDLANNLHLTYLTLITIHARSDTNLAELTYHSIWGRRRWVHHRWKFPTWVDRDSHSNVDALNRMTPALSFQRTPPVVESQKNWDVSPCPRNLVLDEKNPYIKLVFTCHQNLHFGLAHMWNDWMNCVCLIIVLGGVFQFHSRFFGGGISFYAHTGMSVLSPVLRTNFMTLSSQSLAFSSESC